MHAWLLSLQTLVATAHLSLHMRTFAFLQARVERFKQEFAGEQSVDQVVKLASSVAAPVLTAASAVLAASAACGAFFAASKLPIEGNVISRA
jgi:serine/threonine protein kinase HipA of HipAB toxin-antitoxin module